MGVRALVKGLGNQLKGFHWSTEHHDFDFYPMVKALSTAMALETLSLKEPPPNGVQGRLNWLNNCKRLRSLSVAGIRPTSLPSNLPALTTLKIEFDSWPRFNWPAWIGLAYPMLETLEIKDKIDSENTAEPDAWVDCDSVILWCSTVNFPRLRRVIIHNPSGGDLSKKAGESEEEGGNGRARLVSFLESRGATCSFTQESIIPFWNRRRLITIPDAA